MATAAFERPATAAPVETLKPAGRFTRIGEEDLDQPEPPAATPYVSLHAAILAIGLAALGSAGWWFLQLPTADALYERIDARVSSGSPESLHEADEDIRLFLSQFSADPHCKQLRLYQDEIELDNLQRKFERRAKGPAAPGSLLPVEQAYVEALSYARLDPERGMAKLRALIDLFDDGKKRASSDPVGQCLKLAKRQLARLRGAIRRPVGRAARRGAPPAGRRRSIERRQAGAGRGHLPRGRRALWAQALGRRSGPPRQAALDRLGKTSPPRGRPGKL